MCREMASCVGKCRRGGLREQTFCNPSTKQSELRDRMSRRVKVSSPVSFLGGSSPLSFRNRIHVHEREVVVPVMVGRPFVALVALRLAPHLAALRALALRVERVPGMTALAGPLCARRGFPCTFGAVNLHGTRRGRGRGDDGSLVDKGPASGYSRGAIREK